VHGKAGRFLEHCWVNAAVVPRFYPNLVTTVRLDDPAEQLSAVRILRDSNLPRHWAVKDSFSTLDLTVLGFDLLFEARWIRKDAAPDLATHARLRWARTTEGNKLLPAALFTDPDIAMFTGSRDGEVVAGGIANRADGVVGLSNVFTQGGDATAVWTDLAALASVAFPDLPLVGYETGDDLAAAVASGFEQGDPLRVWARAIES
jgi:hypothetical protein